MLNWCGHCKKNTWVNRYDRYLCCPGCGRVIDQSETSADLATSVESDCSNQSYKRSLKKEGGGTLVASGKHKLSSATSRHLAIDVEESTNSTMPIFNDPIESKLDKLIDVISELVEQEKVDNGLTDEVGEALDELKNTGAISGEVYNAVIVRIADSMGMKKMLLRMNIEDRVSFINYLVRGSGVHV
ncbi:hypothetical protein BVC80_1741g48 [Macleaya cordata]|uniref:Uncharacterized protein n=1 Tax=Macleaya cordata TaxID=56857 RepID=A0A200QKL8_MACCD|nr:hypothetical protein BVC80_1741g48 [Macleaya cordata]